MTPSPTAVGVFALPLESTADIAAGTSWLRFQPPSDTACEPGQFFMLSTVAPSPVAYLGRPFSIGDVRDGEWFFMLRALGRGTAWLRTLESGTMMRLVGPLGIGFARADSPVHRMIAGGIGLAPFLFLARRLRAEQPEAAIELYYGERDARSHIELTADEERLFDTVERFTDDGTLGTAGSVVDGLEKQWAEPGVAWYGCGPQPMLRAAAAKLEEHGIGGAQFAFEERMACGFGVCQACIVPNRHPPPRYHLLCTQGPVLEIGKVAW